MKYYEWIKLIFKTLKNWKKITRPCTNLHIGIKMHSYVNAFSINFLQYILMIIHSVWVQARYSWLFFPVNSTRIKTTGSPASTLIIILCQSKQNINCFCDPLSPIDLLSLSLHPQILWGDNVQIVVPKPHREFSGVIEMLCISIGDLG